MTQHPDFDSERRFAFDLARELGQPNVDRMLEGMSALQFDEWKAYFRVVNWEVEQARG